MVTFTGKSILDDQHIRENYSLENLMTVSSRGNDFNNLDTSLDKNAIKSKSQYTRAVCKTSHDETGDMLTKQHATDTFYVFNAENAHTKGKKYPHSNDNQA